MMGLYPQNIVGVIKAITEVTRDSDTPAPNFHTTEDVTLVMVGSLEKPHDLRIEGLCVFESDNLFAQYPVAVVKESRG